MDELICPYDMNWDGAYITDDNLNSVFKKLPKNVLLEVFLDSCHSGTGLRNVNLGRPPELGPENPTLVRFLPPPVDIESRVEGEEDELKPTRGFRSKNRSTVHHILWAGCRSDQTSADAYINGDYIGAFSFYFCKHMRDAGGNISRKNLLKRVRNSLSHNGYSQIPQVETEATKLKLRALTTKGKE